MKAIIFLAMGSMFCQDVLYALLTQAEARNRALLAGVLDSLGWICAIVTTTVSVTVLQGSSTLAIVLTVGFVTAANFAGTMVGTLIGKKFVKDA